MKKVFLILSLLMANLSWGQISITDASFTYQQNFNSLSNTAGTATVTWTNNTTIQGWYLYNKTPADITTYLVDNGASVSGSFFSYGSTSSTERALGGLGSGGSYFGSPVSGTVAGWVAIALKNQTTNTIGSLTFSYTGEQWRVGASTTGSQTMTVEYGIGSTFSSVATWTRLSTSFEFVSPVFGAAAALDGNNAANRVTNLGGTITSLNLPVGSTLWIRFTETNDVGNDHGLAIDDFVISSITLPVAFTSFSATKDGKNNLLSWATASEQNNAGFEVQRSTDGSTYENIGFVKSLSATGNSSSPLSYSFTDFNPLGLQQYYRLKQTDLDGKSAYSAIVLVKREAPATLTVTKVYPNPSTSSIYINAACPAATTLQLSIVDMNGRVVGRKQVAALTGNNGFDMPVAQLAPGTYLLQVLNADNKVVTTEKFIKQ